MQGHEIRVKARVVENESRKGIAILGNRRIIEIKGVWTMDELRQLLGRLK